MPSNQRHRQNNRNLTEVHLCYIDELCQKVQQTQPPDSGGHAGVVLQGSGDLINHCAAMK